MQIYLTPSRTWSVPDLQDALVREFKRAWWDSGVAEVVAHVPLLVNLAARDDAIREKSIARLAIEVKQARALGVKFLVLHPGFYRGPAREDGIARAVESLNMVLDGANGPSPVIALETMAGQGGALGSRFEEMARILSRVHASNLVGVCFDVAHAFIAGYHMSSYRGYESTLEELDSTIGVDRVRVIHVSDSKTESGSGNDRHSSIGEGRMGLQVFHALVRDRRFAHVPKILEIPERDAKSRRDLAKLRTLQATDEPIVEAERPWQLTWEDMTRDGVPAG